MASERRGMASAAEGNDDRDRRRSAGDRGAADPDLAHQIAALERELARLRAGGGGPPPRQHRQKNRLTARFVEMVQKPGFYADGGNLYLDFKEPPAKSWVLRYKRGGRARDHGLGPWPLVSLAEARDAAIDKLRQLRRGIDPIDQRRAARQTAQLERAKEMTFKACAEAYIAAHEKSWKNAKHAAQWPQTLAAYAYPVFGNLPVQLIDTALVMKVLEPL